MYVDPEIANIRQLILSGTKNEGKAELINFLTENPYNDQAWTLAAQMTSDAEQRKIFIKRVFDCSDDMALADWGFQNFSKLKMGLESEITIPPNEYLAMHNYRRIPLDELVAMALTPPEHVFKPVSQIVNQTVSGSAENSEAPIPPLSPSEERQYNDSPASKSHIVNGSMAESTLPLFSLKAIGKWVMLGSGLLFIFIIYSESFMRFFITHCISPFYCCFIPLFLIGAVITVVGYITERKKQGLQKK